jgi:hypothetical protein
LPLISKTITGMHGGVSQQPAALRIDNQCEEMLNCLPTLVDGTRKRPPTEFRAALSTIGTGSRKAHFIDRDTNEKYVVLFTGSASEPIEVYSLLTGAKQTVTLAGTYDNYATTATPEHIKALTIGDHTIIVNTDINTEMSGLPTTELEYPTAVIHVLHGVANTDYNIRINGNLVATYTSGDTSAYNTYKTSVIAAALAASLVSTLGSTNWRIEALDSVIVVWRKNAADFTFAVSDSWGNQALVGIKEEARKLEDLPHGIPTFTHTARTTLTVVGTPVLSLQYYALWQTTYSFAVDGHAMSYGYGNAWGYTNSQIAQAIAAIISSHYTGQPTVTVLVNGAVITLFDAAGIEPLVVTGVSPSSAPIYDEGGTYQGATGGLIAEAHTTDANGQNTIVVNVSGTSSAASSSLTGYYLKWDTTAKDGKYSGGVWTETRKRGMDNNFKASTMPHELVRNADGTFTFQPVSWVERKIGDLDSAPNPSFIGRTISDVLYHKNRIGFLSGGSVILSKSDDYWNFFPVSAMEVLDDDPIDLTVPTTGVDALRWGIPSKGDLLIFGPHDSYLLTSGDQIFSARSASLDSSVNYPISSIASPVKSGANIYFISPKDNYSTVYEYFTQPQTLTDDAADITAHCPLYVPSGISYVTGASLFDLVAVCTGTSNSVYVYKYYWSGDQKAQSAWFRWTFPYTVVAVSIINNYLYLIGKTSTHYILERMNLEWVDTSPLPFCVRLDQQATFATTPNYSGGSTSWTLGYATVLLERANIVIVDKTTGVEIPVSASTATTVSAVGDYRSVPVLIGKRYEQAFTFSEFGIPAPKGNISTPQGRLQLRTLTVCSGETNPYTLVVTPAGRTPKTETSSGTKSRFFIMSNAKDTQLRLSNTSIYPATWFEASWEGYYTTRNQGI